VGAYVKRRSLIRSAIMRYWVAGVRGYKVGFKHRDVGVGERIVFIDMGRIVALGRWALELDDGSSIPYHRVVEIRDDKGVVVWRR